ncbi:membrane protein [Zymomonas mobilis subsp. pomaceae ATCC 29192]|uniref:Membrane protein n=2 Tax=Zymomonas mobilis TaxID=542 RepID=F8EV99_ZYMMT|nr:membrane protein [Zymomonas mobilis subsp. pomaceae ATCC 29192]
MLSQMTYNLSQKISPLKTEDAIRFIAFILRCSVSATAGYLCATMLGLKYPAWAAISALIVSQDKFHETQAIVISRIIGTVIGIVTAVIVDMLFHDVTTELTISVAICAIIARCYPKLRVGMWTCVIVLIGDHGSDKTIIAGLDRGFGVLLGVIIGAMIHLITEKILAATLVTIRL